MSKIRKSTVEDASGKRIPRKSGQVQGIGRRHKRVCCENGKR